MAASGSVTITGNITGLQYGSKGPLGGSDAGITVTGTTNEAAAASVTQTTLASGDNTITVPSANTVGVVIVPSPSSTTTKKLVSNVGVAIGTTTPTLLTFPSGAAANFVINSSAADTGQITEFWWF